MDPPNFRVILFLPRRAARVVGWHPPLHLFIITKDKSFSATLSPNKILPQLSGNFFLLAPEIKKYKFYASSDLLLKCIGLNGCVDI
jgi:hypothetical protein